MTKRKIEKYYRIRAREFIDLLHDKGYFDEEVTRASMRQLQEYLAFVLQSQVSISVEADRIMRDFKEK